MSTSSPSPSTRNGHHVYGVEYPADSLTGEATLGDQLVRCISPEWMFRFKTAYEPAPKDLIDVQALAEKFGFAVPANHRVAGPAQAPSD